MVHLLGVCLLCALAMFDGEDGELVDGIYVLNDREEGRRVERHDGGQVGLGKRLGHKFGQASLYSVSNDNSRFYLDLRNAGPLHEDADRSRMALVIDGICLVGLSHSDFHQDGTMDLSTVIVGKDVAEKIARTLQIKSQLREHPGHRFQVRWLPEKTPFRVGEPVKLTLEIRNTGDVPFTFVDGGQQRGARDNQFRFLAYRSLGHGKAVPDTGDPHNFGGIGSFQTLKPGDTFTKSVTLNKWFQFTEPDTYQITGIYEMELQRADPMAPKRDRLVWDELAVGECVVTIVAKE